ncbi:MAG: hypothetical protein V9H69_23735 [Anaerolineae bacterium]
MTQPQTTSIPAEMLTWQILECLVSEALLDDDLATQIAGRIAQGAMQPLDWKRAFEKSFGLRQRPAPGGTSYA